MWSGKWLLILSGLILYLAGISNACYEEYYDTGLGWAGLSWAGLGWAGL